MHPDRACCVQAPWRLLLIFLLCDTYIKWEALHDNNNNSQQHDEHLFNAALEADFYHMFALALAGRVTPLKTRMLKDK